MCCSVRDGDQVTLAEAGPSSTARSLRATSSSTASSATSATASFATVASRRGGRGRRGRERRRAHRRDHQRPGDHHAWLDPCRGGRGAASKRLEVSSTQSIADAVTAGVFDADTLRRVTRRALRAAGQRANQAPADDRSRRHRGLTAGSAASPCGPYLASGEHWTAAALWARRGAGPATPTLRTAFDNTSP